MSDTVTRAEYDALKADRDALLRAAERLHEAYRKRAFMYGATCAECSTAAMRYVCDAHAPDCPAAPDFITKAREGATPSIEGMLRSMPAGTYILRRKFDDSDSWDSEIEGADCESAFSMGLTEAVEAMHRGAIEAREGR